MASRYKSRIALLSAWCLLAIGSVAQAQQSHATAASAADIKPGSSLRDIKGVAIGTIDSVDATGVVVRLGADKVKVPAKSIGKNAGGLLPSITADQLKQVIARTTPSTAQPANQQLSWMRAVLANLQQVLVDPYSAHYTLTLGFTPTIQTWKIWGVDTTGYFTCGLVNSKNRMGGYVGDTVFIGVVHPDGSVEATMDNPLTSGQRYGGNLLAHICTEKWQQGQLPPIDPTVRQSLLG